MHLHGDPSGSAWLVWDIPDGMDPADAATRLTPGYADSGNSCVGIRALQSTKDTESCETFWRDYLRGHESSRIDLGCHPDPNNAAKSGRPWLEVTLDTQSSGAIRNLTRRHNGSLKHLCEAAWCLLVAHYSGARDLVLCMTRENSRAELAGLVPVRVSLDATTSLESLLGSIAQQHSLVGTQAWWPGLADPDRIESTSSAPPVADTVLDFRLYDALEPIRATLESAGISDCLSLPALGQDLAMQIFAGKSLRLRLSWRADRFDRQAARRIMRHYRSLLTNMEHWASESAALDIPYLSTAECLPCVWPGHHESPVTGEPATLHERFRQRAREFPEHVAVAAENGSLTYGELDRLSDALAYRLIDRGVESDDIVGLCLERSVELIVGILGILKAGAAYLPLDPGYPDERLALMIEDAGVRLAVANPDDAARLGIEIIAPIGGEHPSDARAAAAWRRPGEGGDTAYLIYTSGSTGRPKGVRVSHHNAVRLFDVCRGWLKPRAIDAWSMFHSFAFDFSVWEIWGALLHGGRLEIVPQRLTRSPELFHEWLRDRQISVLSQTPSAFRQLVAVDEEAAADLDYLRLIVFGGEALDYAGLRKWIERHGQDVPRLVNMYGITETTVHVTYRPVSLADTIDPSGSPIGWPLPDLYVLLMDADGHPVPPGVAGEMWVGGDGVALGYLNRPELNEERFVPDPFSRDPECHVYRSGDYARRLPNGELSYLGRKDHEVKIRGFRIDLGEVTAALRAAAGGADAVVVARDSAGGTRRLIGYVVGDGSEGSEQTLRERVSRLLPAHMVPARVLSIAEIPLTANGKTDTRALPDPGRVDETSSGPSDPPRGSVESCLAAIWGDVLEQPVVQRSDDFFQLGGDSIVCLEVVRRAREAGLTIDPLTVFTHSRLSDLAACAGTPREAESEPVMALPLTRAQGMNFLRDGARRSPRTQTRIFAVPGNMDVDTLESAWLATVQRHAALRVRYHLDGAGRRNASAVPAAESLVFSRIEVSHLDDDECTNAISLTASDMADSLDAAAGRLIRVAWFHTRPAEEDRIAVAIHAVAADATSWQLIIEDVEAAYRALKRSNAHWIPTSDDGYREWLSAQEHVKNGELNDWVESGPACLHQVALPEIWREELVDAARRTLGVDTRTLVLAALADAWERTMPDAMAPVVEYEVSLRPAGEASRTVGRLTGLQRLALDNGPARDPLDRLARLKSRMQAAVGSSRPATIWVDAVDLTMAPVRSRLFVELGTQAARNPQASVCLCHPLEVRIGQRNGLTPDITLCHHPEKVPEEQAATLAGQLGDSMRELLEASMTRQRASRTPEDFPLAGLDQAALDHFPVALDEVEEILPLSPMQRLYHALCGTGADIGLGQWVFELEGELDLHAMQAAWRDLLARHEILRTAFVDEGLEQACQVVLRGLDLPVEHQDWRQDKPETQQARLSDYLAADEARPFDVTRGPLTRVALMHTGPRQWVLVWTYHHLQIDGWSWPVLLADLATLYDAHRTGNLARLPAPGRYREYMAWLDGRDRSEYADFWRGQLGRPVVATRPLAGRSSPGHRSHVELELAPNRSERLERFARQRRMTPSGVVQAAWSLVIAGLTETFDVTIGMVFTGRTTGIPGGESIVGPMVNDMPVRLNVAPDQRVSDWLDALRQLHARINHFQNASLAELHEWAELPPGSALFESLLVFQNFALGSVARQWGETLTVKRVSSAIRTNYPLTLVVTPGERYRIELLSTVDDIGFERLEQIGKTFVGILDSLIANPEGRLGTLLLRVPRLPAPSPASNVATSGSP
ncbi:MAG: amino acid adenylation domain-containing protein, partial [Gammaproteobacteria bacterium]